MIRSVQCLCLHLKDEPRIWRRLTSENNIPENHIIPTLHGFMFTPWILEWTNKHSWRTFVLLKVRHVGASSFHSITQHFPERATSQLCMKSLQTQHMSVLSFSLFLVSTKWGCQTWQRAPVLIIPQSDSPSTANCNCLFMEQISLNLWDLKVQAGGFLNTRPLCEAKLVTLWLWFQTKHTSCSIFSFHPLKENKTRLKKKIYQIDNPSGAILTSCTAQAS